MAQAPCSRGSSIGIVPFMLCSTQPSIWGFGYAFSMIKVTHPPVGQTSGGLIELEFRWTPHFTPWNLVLKPDQFRASWKLVLPIQIGSTLIVCV